jgi:hypothetical protein
LAADEGVPREGRKHFGAARIGAGHNRTMTARTERVLAGR